MFSDSSSLMTLKHCFFFVGRFGSIFLLSVWRWYAIVPYIFYSSHFQRHVRFTNKIYLHIFIQFFLSFHSFIRLFWLGDVRHGHFEYYLFAIGCQLCVWHTNVWWTPIESWPFDNVNGKFFYMKIIEIFVIDFRKIVSKLKPNELWIVDYVCAALNEADNPWVSSDVYALCGRNCVDKNHVIGLKRI